jgi:Tfp pilus assembly protein PilF
MNSQRLQKLEKFHKDEPDNEFIIYALAMEYEKINLSLALKYYEKLLKDHPGYLPAYYQVAHIYWEDEEIEKANDIFQKGIALAEEQDNQKTLHELKAAYHNFKIENDC